jgi:hypothetical protein
MLIVSPSVGRAAFAVSVGVAWLDLTSFEQYVRFSFASARGASGPRPRGVSAEASDQPAAVAHQLALGLSVGVATRSASPSQSKDNGTRYGAPSAEALAIQTSVSSVSRCSASRRR